MDTFNYFLPLSKVEKNSDGTRTVTGYASTPALDLDGEIVSLNAMKDALPSYMEWKNVRLMHQPIVAGTAKEATVDDKGLYLKARIVNPDVIKLLDEDALKGFSIGGKILAKTGNTITSLNLIEISLVDRPANPECKIDSIKGAFKDITLFSPEDPVEEVSYLRSLVSKLVGVVVPTQSVIKDYSDTEYMTLCKREFSDKERSDAASAGEAMPDGSYPIKTVQDLKNAVQAFGRAKDPDKTKAHIISRARALKATDHLPADWEGSTKKESGAFVLEVDDVRDMLGSDLFGKVVVPPTTLTEATRKSVVGLVKPLAFGKAEKTKVERIEKGMHVLADLVYAFGMVRDAQRRLLIEGAVEKDGDDEALSHRLGQCASELAQIIGQKAEHEGSEALFMTDADDLRFISYQPEGSCIMTLSAENLDLAKRASKASMAKVSHHLKKAGAAHAKGMAALMKCGNMMGKAATGETLKASDVMAHLRSAHEHFSESGDHMEMAHAALTKGAGVVEGGGEAGTMVTDDGPMTGGAKEFITDKTHGEMTEGGAPWYASFEPYPGSQAADKSARYTQAQVDELLKGAEAKGKLGAVEAENATLKALLAKAPAGGQRPALFAVDKALNIQTGLPENATPRDILLDGVDLISAQGDPNDAIKAAGQIMNNMIGDRLNGNRGGFAKSVFDPNFKGKAGAGKGA